MPTPERRTLRRAALDDLLSLSADAVRRGEATWTRDDLHDRGETPSVRTFVDTNVLVYLFDSEEPQKQRRARELVGTLAREGALALSTQVLSEFFVTVTRRLEEPLPVPERAAGTRRPLCVSVRGGRHSAGAPRRRPLRSRPTIALGRPHRRGGHRGRRRRSVLRRLPGGAGLPGCARGRPVRAGVTGRPRVRR